MSGIGWLANIAAIVLGALAVYCGIMALIFARPRWQDTPVLTWAVWHLGWIIVSFSLLLVAGGLVGLASRAVWKLLAP